MIRLHTNYDYNQVTVRRWEVGMYVDYGQNFMEVRVPTREELPQRLAVAFRHLILNTSPNDPF